MTDDLDRNEGIGPDAPDERVPEPDPEPNPDGGDEGERKDGE